MRLPDGKEIKDPGELLNYLGDSGWELVGIVPVVSRGNLHTTTPVADANLLTTATFVDKVRLIFKRPKPEQGSGEPQVIGSAQRGDED
jgi:hypothetical protein